MEFKNTHTFGIITGLILIGVSFLFINTNFFFLVMGLGIIFGTLPFVLSVIQENKINTEKEEMFLEFARDLVESVKSGTPINRSIVNAKDSPYGALSPNIKKLANQISIGIPLKTALQIFSEDIHNRTISRALTLIGQAEKAGGDIGKILESVASAVSMSDKLGKERKSSASTLIVQGYVIFFIFLIIILVMQYKIIPLISTFNTSGLAAGGQAFGSPIAITGGGSTSLNPNELSQSFLYLILVQGLFSGLTIGKLSEGSVRAGIKHSFALMIISFIVTTGSTILFG
ncbi:MAG TPA: type II secretion system F family protein [Candidatus Omnitrophota bacterium]|nr:type II secretion system F family protein [Candidatus Omnitrophota bacterium]